jgi:hypothetical protein
LLDWQRHRRGRIAAAAPAAEPQPP